MKTSLASVLASVLSIVFARALPAQAPRLPDFERRTPIVLAVENVGPAVASIKTQSKVERRSHPFGGLFQQWDEEAQRGFSDRSVGSGVVIHPAGFLVTNEHVVAGADRIFVQFGEAAGGKEEPRKYEAEVLNSDVDNDLAVLKIMSPGPFPYAVFGDSDALLTGETAIALGCPFGIGASVTTGVLSAKNRPVMFQGKEVFRDFLQTSALIHPGNSGGPLLDINGYVIGINVAIDLRGAGIGYAIPANRVRDVLTQLTDPTMVRRAALGAELEAKNDGLRIGAVESGGAAGKSGLRTGDVLLAVGGAPVKSRLDFNLAALAKFDAGPMQVKVRRGDATEELNVVLETAPLSALSRRTFAAAGFATSDVNAQLAREFRLESSEGAVITAVDKDGPAARIDLRPGDVLYQAGRFRVKNSDALAKVLEYYGKSRPSIEVMVLRGGQALKGALPLP